MLTYNICVADILLIMMIGWLAKGVKFVVLLFNFLHAEELIHGLITFGK